MSENQKRLIKVNSDLMDKQYKWSWAKAGIGLWKNSLGAREFWFFAIITWQIQQRLNIGLETPVYWISYCVVGICFIFHKALEQLLSNGKLAIEGKFGISKEIKQGV